MALTNRFLKSFIKVPDEIFRVNFGLVVRLREHLDPSRPPPGPFDLLTEAGKAKPRALDPATYLFPNGASMRPNSRTLQNLVRRVKGDVYIYSVPAGTEIPEHLILVHEFRDHFSLQARREMTVEELNTQITDFLTTKGHCFAREQWLQEYPHATYFWK
ncbi:hypothetical protein PABG_01656 [Paracoccidioides brasiliensis Pb03]|uniref:Tse2 ADP-ribosyltransferase toxin domain-containing protein n=1 Tax=Paracoccidioides brasiliensis (strain Pb18) TaxID=502780 RepID=C1G917_PARBD|nr:uncharacterized protein PADG_03753 [Paracoccidioides brasiliensis Pb18]EEH19337.2 hypothetical protein PABG_01656 [Paracoccidioides brasiliensis Pb03]EEH47669.2 hypothetical protein PADG_03753 [Paracoccidioides brasiliensis Pb18]